MNYKSHLLLALFLIFSLTTLFAQKKYQGLLWKISGNGLEKPSYMYGTMHVSNKIAFYLGSPFYNALQSVDKVALELEPELWFDEVLGGDFLSYSLRAAGVGKMMNFNGGWNEYEGSYKLDTNIRDNIKILFKQSPEMVNQLLFRFQDRTGNFEEGTWLDMHIYQTAKKFNKPTFGLETFKGSMEMLMKANKESIGEKNKMSNLNFTEVQNLRFQLENAYRDGDLDLLDSLNKIMSTPSTTKYVLIERNKIFIHSIDSILPNESLFIAMGAAHLPGEEGVIEMLRKKGYTVEPYDRGKRDSKQMDKIEKIVVKQALIKFTTPDGLLSFESPYKSYNMDLVPGSSGVISMDIANGLTYTISRMITHNNLFNLPKERLLASVDEILYEMVPGKIISKKIISNNNNPGFDIYNKTGKGDIHRSQLFFLDNEIVLIKLSGSGDKIKKGVGDYFFSTLKLTQNPILDWTKRVTADKSLEFEVPGRMSAYGVDEKNKLYGNLMMEFNRNESTYLVKRFNCTEKDFLDEDKYELFKLSDAFKADFKIETITSNHYLKNSGYELTEAYEPYKGKNVYANYRTNGNTCYSFFAFCDTITKAEKFFNSIKISAPKSSINDEYIDSTLFFKTKITWEASKNDFDRIFGSLYNYGLNDKELTDATEYNKEKKISNPTTSEEIYVRYFRYGKYDFYDDSALYEKELKKLVSKGNDYIVDKESIIWDNGNMQAEFWFSDTATTKKVHRKEILHNHSLHSIEVTYDSITGESDFVKNFINHFEPLKDTLCATNLFLEKDSLLLHDLISADSAIFKQANENIHFSYSYHLKTQLNFYKSINDSIPTLANDEDKENYKNNLLWLQYLDNSAENIASLKKEYYASIDSASYQKEILNNFSLMKTAEAYKTLKELIINEPPIGIEFYRKADLFDNLTDSLALTKTLYPELLELTHYKEYKPHVIKLLATLVDSNEINKNIYLKNLPNIIRDAKSELKRVASGYQEKDAIFLSSYSELYGYWSILYPYVDKPDVKAYFKLVNETNKKNIIASYAEFKKTKGEKISDDVCNIIITTDKNYENYLALEKLDRTDYIADTINMETSYIEYAIKELWNYSYDDENKVDSIQLVQTSSDTIRTRSYNTYYYKYYKENEWYAAVVMLQNKEKMQPKYTTIKSLEKINEDDKEEKVFEKLRLTVISKNRDNNYLSSDEYGDYDEEELDFDFDF